MTSKYKILLHYALLPNPIDSVEDEIYELSLCNPVRSDEKTYLNKELKLLNSILKDLKGKLVEY